MELALNPVGDRAVPLGEQGLTVERLGDDLRLTRTLREGQTAGVVLESMSGRPRRVPPAELEQLTDETARFWREWVGRCSYRERWRREMVTRSAVTLKLMTYAPSGALVAAPTTGLPEFTGGERNWDYRYGLDPGQLLFRVRAARARPCGRSRRVRALAQTRIHE